MNLLILTPRFPYPPTRGDCVRAWGELEFLAHRHRVWLACLDHHLPQPEHLQTVRACCQDVLVITRSRLAAFWRGGLRFLAGGSLVEGHFADRRLAGAVDAWAAQVRFDAVLIFSPEMAQYATRLPAAVRRVLDMNDVESGKWQTYARRTFPPLRWLYACEARRLARAEQRWAQTHAVSLLVNQRERRKLLAAVPTARTAVVHTGVSTDGHDSAVAPRPPACPACSAVRAASGSERFREPPPPPKTAEPIVGFVGSLFYPPNVRAVNWFGRAVWPRVQQARPDARWLIVGNRPRRGVRRWSRRPGVTVTGFVPDIRPYLARMRVFVCPVTDEIGVQTKLIEALAAGRPAVVSPQAAAGIDYVGPPPFLIASDAAEFAATVVRLLADPALAADLSQRAAAFIAQSYGPNQYALVEQWLDGAPIARAVADAAARDGCIAANTLGPWVPRPLEPLSTP